MLEAQRKVNQGSRFPTAALSRSLAALNRNAFKKPRRAAIQQARGERRADARGVRSVTFNRITNDFIARKRGDESVETKRVAAHGCVRGNRDLAAAAELPEQRALRENGCARRRVIEARDERDCLRVVRTRL